MLAKVVLAHGEGLIRRHEGLTTGRAKSSSNDARAKGRIRCRVIIYIMRLRSSCEVEKLLITFQHHPGVSESSPSSFCDGPLHKNSERHDRNSQQRSQRGTSAVQAATHGPDSIQVFQRILGRGNVQSEHHEQRFSTLRYAEMEIPLRRSTVADLCQSPSPSLHLSFSWIPSTPPHAVPQHQLSRRREPARRDRTLKYPARSCSSQVGRSQASKGRLEFQTDVCASR